MQAGPHLSHLNSLTERRTSVKRHRMGDVKPLV